MSNESNEKFENTKRQKKNAENKKKCRSRDRLATKPLTGVAFNREYRAITFEPQSAAGWSSVKFSCLVSLAVSRGAFLIEGFGSFEIQA